MNSPANDSPPAKAQALDEAFEALKTYDAGSSRGLLVPIDDAVVTSLRHGSERAQLEVRLIAALRNGGSVAARDYLCAKLALIGTKTAASALPAALRDVKTNTASRNALEAVPDPTAAKALRESLPSLPALQKLGTINSLGARRDEASVGTLTKLLRDPNLVIVSAAIAALGRIGTRATGKVLVAFRKKLSPSVIPYVDDATLVCAEHLLAAGQKKYAAQLYQTLAGSDHPAHIKDAAARGLRKSAGSAP